MLAGQRFENGPRKNIRSLEMSQAKLPGRGIKAEMLVPAVRTKHQPGGTRLIIEAHCNAQFKRRLWSGSFRKAERAAAKSFAHAFDVNLSVFLTPARVKERRPLASIQRTERKP